MADTIAFYDHRMTAILEAAKHAFAEKGIDGASMQDLARAAGMSAGNFYRYFPSKSAIVAAMISRDLEGFQRDFEIVKSSPDPIQALKDKFLERIDNPGCDDGPLWAEIDAAALRRDDICTLVAEMEREITFYLISVFARISGLPLDVARQRFSAQVVFVMVLFKGAAQRLSGRGCQMPDEVRQNLRGLILKTIDQTLAEIASTASGDRKG